MSKQDSRSEKKIQKKRTIIEATQIGLHSVRNILGDQQKTNLFSNHDEDFCEEYGVKLEGKIDRFGIDLTEIQSRIMEGILFGFSRTAYRGNIEPESKDQISLKKYSGRLPETFKYIQEIPKIRVTQSEILEWSGINKNSIASWTRAIEAIQELGTRQYCFYYDRLALDEDGTPIRDKNKRWKKEEVIAVDTLFTIKEIREEGSGNLKYYEIMPSPVFLDQRESYFMFIPLNWRDEVKNLVGNKKASSYTFRFLLFLRYQFELKRRSKQQSAYQIKWSPEEIAIAIKMPPSIYKRKKKRADEILEDAYQVAKKLDYLTDYSRKGYIDILTLNNRKYFSPSDLSLKNAIGTLEEKGKGTQSEATLLFYFFHESRKKLDPHHQQPDGPKKVDQLKGFQELLKNRKLEDIQKLILWSITKKYWCSRLATPLKLNQNFSEAWSEFTVESDCSKETLQEVNKQLAKEIVQNITKNAFGAKIEILNQYVEVGNGIHQPVCISYTDGNFEAKFKEALKKWGVVL